MKTTKQDAWLAPGVNSSHRNYNLDVETIKQAARGHWRHILTGIGIDPRLLTGKHCPCPVCGGKDRFRFDDKQGSGSFYCSHCQPGDGLKLVMLFTGKNFSDTVRLVADIVNVSPGRTMNTTRQTTPCATDSGSNNEKRRTQLNKIWEESLEVSNGDPVWRYLIEHRGIKIDMVPECLRFHPALDYYEQKNGKPKKTSTYTAMLALVSDSVGQPVTIHRTYLTQDGKKAPVDSPKKLMPPAIESGTKGGAIRLAEADHRLNVAEGLETALACQVETMTPTWATISASLMPSLIVPDSVKEIVIFADNDKSQAGQKAAQKLAKRLVNEGRRVKILIPPEVDTDWLDHLSAQSAGMGVA